MTDKTSDKAAKIVRNHMSVAVATGLVPVPLVDLVAISGIQLKMLHSLAALYDQKLSDNQGKAAIASLLASVVPLSLKSSLFSLCKGVPVLGQAVGLLGLSALSGASTYAIGMVFVQHFESGGTLLDFDPQKVQDHYYQQFRDGKKIVKDKSYAGVKP